MLLSICIPTKNRAAVLQKSLQSIVSQGIFTERDDIEIVVCDNGSTDRSVAIAESMTTRQRVATAVVRDGGRIFTGVAAGLAYPTTLALITALWGPGKARVKAIALWSGIGGGGAVLARKRLKV